MAGRAITKESIKKQTIGHMKKLGTFKPEFEPIIDIYAELREQYERLTNEFKKKGYEYKTETIQGGEKKSALVATLESLRKDVLAYSDRLCLNPKTLNEDIDKEKGAGKKTTLEGALLAIEKGL